MNFLKVAFTFFRKSRQIRVFGAKLLQQTSLTG